jgi:hypothetical protein
MEIAQPVERGKIVSRPDSKLLYDENNVAENPRANHHAAFQNWVHEHWNHDSSGEPVRFEKINILLELCHKISSDIFYAHIAS